MDIINFVMDNKTTLGDLTAYNGNDKLAEVYPSYVQSGLIKLGSMRHDFKCNISKLLTKSTCLIDHFKEVSDTEFKLDITKLKAFIYAIGFKESSKRTLMSSINQLIKKHADSHARYELCLSILTRRR